MSKIDSYYNKIKKKYLSQGFRKLRRTFVREKDGVIQTFSLKHNSYGPFCTVEFGIRPLCLPYKLYIEVSVYELDRMIPELYCEGWRYDPDDSQNMEECIQKLSDAIDCYIIPFFDRCTDSKSSLVEILKLENTMEESRLLALKARGRENKAQKRTPFHDTDKYYLALKAQDYGYAEDFLRFQIDYLKGEIENFEHSKAYSEKSKEANRLDYLEYQNQLEQMKQSNFQYFEKMLNENEQRMRAYLCENYPTIWKK